VKVTSIRAAAAEAMRIRRNINVLLLRERKAADTCTSHRTAGYPKPRSRELRALDLDQTNLTFIYVNALHYPLHRGCFQQLDLDPMLNAELNAIKMLRERGKL
jgi:hypothetical protein